MSCTLKRAGPVAIVYPTGELKRDNGNDGFTAAINTAFALDVVVVAISCAQVTVLLSEGIRRLVTLKDQANAAGKAFHITDLPPQVRYTLKITNLLGFLNHLETSEEILERYDQSPAALRIVSVEAAAPAAIAADSEAAAAPTEPAPTPAQTAEKDDAATAAAPPSAKPVGGGGVGKAPSRYYVLGMNRKKNGAADASAAAPKTHTAPAPSKPLPTLTDAALQKLVRRHLPGRLAVEIVDIFCKTGASVLDVTALSQKIGAPPQTVRHKAKELAARGVLKPLGGDTFNYAPPPEVDEELRAFLRDWHSSLKQPRLLALLLAQETQKSG